MIEQRQTEQLSPNPSLYHGLKATFAKATAFVASKFNEFKAFFNPVEIRVAKPVAFAVVLTGGLLFVMRGDVKAGELNGNYPAVPMAVEGVSISETLEISGVVISVNERSQVITNDATEPRQVVINDPLNPDAIQAYRGVLAIKEPFQVMPTVNYTDTQPTFVQVEKDQTLLLFWDRGSSARQEHLPTKNERVRFLFRNPTVSGRALMEVFAVPGAGNSYLKTYRLIDGVIVENTTELTQGISYLIDLQVSPQNKLVGFELDGGTYASGDFTDFDIVSEIPEKPLRLLLPLAVKHR